MIIVERGEQASAKELREIAKIAKRDGASVILSERDPNPHQQSHQTSRTRTP